MFTGSKQQYEKDGVPRVWEKGIGLFANSIGREGFGIIWTKVRGSLPERNPHCPGHNKSGRLNEW